LLAGRIDHRLKAAFFEPASRIGKVYNKQGNKQGLGAPAPMPILKTQPMRTNFHLKKASI
jgi:hypothetical protein